MKDEFVIRTHRLGMKPYVVIQIGVESGDDPITLNIGGGLTEAALPGLLRAMLNEMESGS